MRRVDARAHVGTAAEGEDWLAHALDGVRACGRAAAAGAGDPREARDGCALRVRVAARGPALRIARRDRLPTRPFLRADDGGRAARRCADAARCDRGVVACAYRRAVRDAVIVARGARGCASAISPPTSTITRPRILPQACSSATTARASRCSRTRADRDDGSAMRKPPARRVRALARRARAVTTDEAARRIAADAPRRAGRSQGPHARDAPRRSSRIGRRRCSSTISDFPARSRTTAWTASSPTRSWRRPAATTNSPSACCACRVCYQVNDHRRAAAAVARRAATSGLPRERRWCSPASTRRTSSPSRSFARGSTSLREHDDAVLWLDASRTRSRGGTCVRSPSSAALRRRAHHRSRRWCAQAAHIARLRCADLALDVLPYGSHTTGSDALFAGVPLLTCRGHDVRGPRRREPLQRRRPAASSSRNRLPIMRARLRALCADRARLAHYQRHLETERAAPCRCSTPRRSRATSSSCSKARRTAALIAPLVLDQLDLVAVRILDERDHGRAALDRTGFARDLAALGSHRGAGGGRVGHRDRDVAERGAELVAIDAVVVRELDFRAVGIVRRSRRTRAVYFCSGRSVVRSSCMPSTSV